MRAFTNTQNRPLPQIDMAQIARNSSDTILGFNKNKHSRLRSANAQSLAYHAIISTTSIAAILVIGIITF